MRKIQKTQAILHNSKRKNRLIELLKRGEVIEGLPVRGRQIAIYFHRPENILSYDAQYPEPSEFIGMIPRH